LEWSFYYERMPARTGCSQAISTIIDQESIIEKASQGFLALSLDMGLDVLAQLMGKRLKGLR